MSEVATDKTYTWHISALQFRYDETENRVYFLGHIYPDGKQDEYQPAKWWYLSVFDEQIKKKAQTDNISIHAAISLLHEHMGSQK